MVPHGNKQRQVFTLLRAARYERENGTATSAAGQRTDHPCQTEFSSISVVTTPAENFKFSKAADHAWWFFSGWGRRLEKDRHLGKHQFSADRLGAHANNVYQQFPAIKLQDLPQIACQLYLPTNAAKPPLSRITWLHTRTPESVFTNGKEAQREMGGPLDNHGWGCRKKQKVPQHVPGVCLLACEAPRTSHGPCKLMK